MPQALKSQNEFIKAIALRDTNCLFKDIY